MKFTKRAELKLINLLLRVARITWKHTHIGKYGFIGCPIELGKGTWISDGFRAKGHGKIRIGRYCSIGEDVKIITSSHDTSYPSMNFIFQSKITNTHYPTKITEVTIGHDVWIGDNVIILPGANIGNGAVIGAGSIVTRTVGDYEIHAGVPAKFIRHRIAKELIEPMLQASWWDWDDDKLQKNKDFFSSPASLKSINSIKP
jgi:virginiamycin A acetyltransferase